MTEDPTGLNDVDAEVRREQISRLTLAANLYRRRGDFPQAVSACQELLTLDPSNLDAREVLAGVLAEEGKHDEAIEEYRAIVAADPNRVEAERQIALLSLRRSEVARRELRALEVVDDPSKRNRGTERMSLAWAAAAVLPGGGQLYLRQYGKGVALLVLWLLLIALVLQKALFEPLSAAVHARRPFVSFFEHLSAQPGIGVLVVIAGILALCLHAYGIIDTVRAVRQRETREEEELGI